MIADEEESPSKYQKKHKSLEELVEPLFHRASELKNRPVAVEQLQLMFAYSENVTEQVKANMTWVPEDKTEKLLQKVGETRSWLNEKLAAQNGLTLHEPPVLLSTDIQSKSDDLLKSAAKLLAIPKPRPKPKKTKKMQQKKALDIKSHKTT